MRLNVDSYRCILAEKRLSDAEVVKSTGLSERTYKWILENGFIECETLERIADAMIIPDWSREEERKNEHIRSNNACRKGECNIEFHQ